MKYMSDVYLRKTGKQGVSLTDPGGVAEGPHHFSHDMVEIGPVHFSPELQS